jgi:hypothetical protein
VVFSCVNILSVYVFLFRLIHRYLSFISVFVFDQRRFCYWIRDIQCWEGLLPSL